MWRAILILFFLFKPYGEAQCEKHYAASDTLDGALRCLDESGRLQSLAYYQKGKLQGDAKVWDPETGSLRAQAGYIGGELDGVRRTYFPDGHIQNETPFSKSKRNGLEREWDAGGRVRSAREWANDQWIKTTYLDEAGRVRRQEEPGADRVTFREYHRNGRLKEEGAYPLGHPDQREGLVRSYRADGTLESETRFEGGAREGLQKIWDENGALRSREWYQKGELVSQTTYDPDGRVLESTELFAIERPVANVKFTNGKTDESSQISQSRRQGAHREYDEKGQLQLESHYENGILEGDVRTYFADGRPSQVIAFTRGEKNGPESTFYQNGKLRSRGFYKRGLKEGSWQQFDPYGRLIFQGAYAENRPHGTQTYFQPEGEIEKYDRGRLVSRETSTRKETYYPDGSPRL